MAILQDTIQQHTYIEYIPIDHRVDELEGSQLCFTYVEQGKVVYKQRFGWTNRTVHAFIHMLQYFPLRQYDGYFSHFEKHLEMKWSHNEEHDHYTIQFIDADISMTIQAGKEQLITFGHQFQQQWHQSTVIE
ncbi:hypothetical protein [Paenibacillus wenxiniae]|uniref:Uncharacterized protein n=1 Tax=Paenibacillus wenxiniae TaxID=1636843 RepID=A0ABW4RMK2_9BACL